MCNLYSPNLCLCNFIQLHQKQLCCCLFQIFQSISFLKTLIWHFWSFDEPTGPIKIFEMVNILSQDQEKIWRTKVKREKKVLKCHLENEKRCFLTLTILIFLQSNCDRSIGRSRLWQTPKKRQKATENHSEETKKNCKLFKKNQNLSNCWVFKKP